ncbi:hypothetical protein ACFE04_007745 [Oxalis oulophora]
MASTPSRLHGTLGFNSIGLFSGSASTSSDRIPTSSMSRHQSRPPNSRHRLRLPPAAVLVPNYPDGVPFGRGGRVAPKRGRRQVKKGESKWNRAKWRETKGERRGDSTKERIKLVEASSNVIAGTILRSSVAQL